ncbi:MAG: UDP-N-acetylmuramate:L-alanyl-gamma-D-glutamyl-meso-diaminopimelate ligase [Betaproteobacteria bacterium]|nr:UDP-N-acetylmuramate:L-alanyl-gamma-D-glutamyl-meso-diaminopimelate ligase [Betaproteobacteria bacterium]
MHIHILGICGTFMGGVAVLAQAAGHRVTGCDAQVYPPMSTQLKQQGIGLIEGFDEGQLELAPDLFVIGNVVSRGNPLMEAILERGLPYVSGPQWLADNILARCRVLAIAGTHGKTTTASLAAWLFEAAGLQPGFLIGGVPGNFAASARLPGAWGQSNEPGHRPWFVIEADEYDTAFFDKRSKFVHYRPQVAILNNLEYDHADIFPDLTAIETQFHHLVRTVPRNGLLVANGRDQALQRVLARGCWTPVEWFGRPQDWDLDASDSPATLTVLHRGVPAGALDSWPLLGEHNRQNALAALLAARFAGIPMGQGLDSLANFRGVKRRMEVRGTVRGVTLYDDFAHHPTAIQTTIAGLRRKVGSGARILAVIEPRSNTMKLGVWADALGQSLEGADRVFCYSAQLGWDAAAAMKVLGERALTIDNLDALVEAVASEARSGDHLLVMSNGSFGGIHDRILKRLSEGTAIP